MNPSRERFYRGVFLTAAIYDTVLGVVFTFFHSWAFDVLDAKVVAEEGLLPLVGAFLLVIGVAYYLIYLGELWRNRDLIVVGTLYKAAYAAVAFWTAIFGEVAHWTFVGIFGVADVIFFVLMAECLVHMYRHQAPPAGETLRGTAATR
jgi:hypothetical protein